MRIKITRNHIQNGTPESVDACPIALAIKESVCPNDINVGTSILKIGKMKLKLPAKAQAFIRRFDDEKPVKPFQFEI